MINMSIMCYKHLFLVLRWKCKEKKSQQIKVWGVTCAGLQLEYSLKIEQMEHNRVGTKADS